MTPASPNTDIPAGSTLAGFASVLQARTARANELQKPPNFTSGKAFIGGGCCVSLSVEYVPSTATATPEILVFVEDADGTVMMWGRTEPPGSGYRIKEGVITSNPGATLGVMVSDCTARVRWCEVFSC